MAKEPENDDRVLTSDKQIRNTIVDKSGRESFSLDFTEREYEDSSGNVDYKITDGKYAEGSDGTVFSATQLSQPESRGGVTLQRCDGCVAETQTFLNSLRNRSRSQIVYAPAKKMRRCFSCRRNFCERHFVISPDRRARCQQCDRKHRYRQVCLHILKSIFLKKV